jgi:hypothetical protein
MRRLLLLTAMTLPARPLPAQLAPHPVRVLSSATLADPRLVESSGVIPSRTQSGVLFTINDSGNDPLIFATDTAGDALGAWLLPGAVNRDWESVTIGSCPGGSCLFVGDIGDNAERRPGVTIYRLREPKSLDSAGPAPTAASLDLDSAAVRYADGPHDAEAMWVSAAGDLCIVTKGRSGRIGLYLVPAAAFGAGTPVRIERLQTLPITPDRRFGRWVTDAARSPDGRRVVIRTYTELFFFNLRNDRLGDVTSSCNVAGLEQQGEGVAWLDDRRLVLTSEAGTGVPGTLHVVTCDG